MGGRRPLPCLPAYSQHVQQHTVTASQGKPQTCSKCETGRSCHTLRKGQLRDSHLHGAILTGDHQSGSREWPMQKGREAGDQAWGIWREWKWGPEQDGEGGGDHLTKEATLGVLLLFSGLRGPGGLSWVSLSMGKREFPLAGKFLESRLLTSAGCMLIFIGRKLQSWNIRLKIVSIYSSISPIFAEYLLYVVLGTENAGG